MSKAFQLTIPTPCHEDWNKMTPDEKGRFCSSCQKQVVDFTSMSNQQLAAFFKKPSTGSVCGRFNNDQLNQDLQVPQKRILWLKYFFTIVLPAFFTTSKATAQGGVSKVLMTGKTKMVVVPHKKTSLQLGAVNYSPAIIPVVKTECIAPDIIVGDVNVDLVESVIIEPMPIERIVEGKVINDSGESLAFASITIKGTNARTKTDANGSFKIAIPIKEKTLLTTHIGYEPKEITLEENSKNVLITLIKPLKEIWLGEVIIQPVYKQKLIPLIPQVSDTSFKNFKFYPNPAAQGSIITVEWNKPEGGQFEIQLMNQQGQVVNRKTESFIEKLNSMQYSIPSVTPGSYFLVIINRKSGKKLTEKIIIQ